MAGDDIIDVRSLIPPATTTLSSASNPRLLLLPPAPIPSRAPFGALVDPIVLKLSENGSRSVPCSALPPILAPGLLPLTPPSFVGLLGALTAGPTRTPIPEIPAAALAVRPIDLMVLLTPGAAGSPCGTTACLPPSSPNSLNGGSALASPSTALREILEVVEKLEEGWREEVREGREERDEVVLLLTVEEVTRLVRDWERVAGFCALARMGCAREESGAVARFEPES